MWVRIFAEANFFRQVLDGKDTLLINKDLDMFRWVKKAYRYSMYGKMEVIHDPEEEKNLLKNQRFPTREMKSQVFAVSSKSDVFFYFVGAGDQPRTCSQVFSPK